jgi:hypothetical protein
MADHLVSDDRAVLRIVVSFDPSVSDRMGLADTWDRLRPSAIAGRRSRR